MDGDSSIRRGESREQENTAREPPSEISNTTAAALKRKRKIVTCDACRKHTKCELSRPSVASDRSHDASLVCVQCQKDGIPCTRTKYPIKFSHATAEKFGNGLAGSRGLTSLKTPKKLVYIDETAELVAFYSQSDEPDSYSTAYSGAGPAGVWNASYIQREDQQRRTATRVSVDSTAFPPGAWWKSSPDQGPYARSVDLAASHNPGSWIPEPSQLSGGLYSGDASTPGDTHPNISDSLVMRGLIKPPSASCHVSLSHSTLEIVLLRYYIDHLSMWLDLCDPERHFEMVVPQRARRCRPLMNAILAASARHLTRIPRYRTASGRVKYNGRVLDELTNETALHYHNKCINDLLELGTHPEQTRNEDLLAAAIILRFYEEIDYPLQDEEKDNELFLRVINIFIEAQIPNMPLTPQMGSSRPNCLPVEPKRWYMADLRQAGFWVAFRQEVYSAFLKQRPFNMSLSRCEAFRSFSPAEDALWTARLVIFCADVLDFCYGSSSADITGVPDEHEHEPSQSTREKWLKLKDLEKKWTDILPDTFEPIYFRDADRRKGEVFPQICYVGNLHVAGVQHLELARILLAVYDPTRPQLGFGHVASMRVLGQELKASVLRLCGIAVNNRKNPPALTTALLGIVVCGEHFEDGLEQRALLGVLDELEYDHGWPVGDSREKLKGAWRI